MVKQRLVSNFNNILRAKIYVFLKKSIWKYLILSILIGYLKPIDEFNAILTAVIYFTGIMIVLWPLQYISTKAFSKKINFDALVEFNDDEIIINHYNKDQVETKGWDWIKNIELNKNRIWLTINQSRPFVLSLPKSKLMDNEIKFFERMKKTKNNY